MTKPIPIKAATQNHLPIADIREDVVLTKGGGACLVLRSSSLNFSLLSGREQEAVTYAYAALLNSLSFPIQILVRSHKKDIARYISYLASKEKGIDNQKLKELMASYRNFVSQIVKKKNVLEKEFFIVIPFSPSELGVSISSVGELLVPGKKKKISYPRDYVIKKAKTALYPRRDHLIRQVGRLGIKVQQLTTEELLKLFYKGYNSEERETERGL